MSNYYGMSSAGVAELTSPRRFEGNGITWNAYAAALRLLDAVWRERRVGNTAFGVFGPQPSWEDTIERGRPLFEVESWAELDDQQASMIAPTHFFADGDALLGSVGRRSSDVRAFLFAPDHARDRDQQVFEISRGSAPGERRGGRQKGTPNKRTLAKQAVALETQEHSRRHLHYISRFPG